MQPALAAPCNLRRDVRWKSSVSGPLAASPADLECLEAVWKLFTKTNSLQCLPLQNKVGLPQKRPQEAPISRQASGGGILENRTTSQLFDSGSTSFVATVETDTFSSKFARPTRSAQWPPLARLHSEVQRKPLGGGASEEVEVFALRRWHRTYQLLYGRRASVGEDPLWRCALTKPGSASPREPIRLRSFDRSMPEEINRLLTDSISDLLLVSEPSGVANLRREGIPEGKIRFVGNVMIDTFMEHRQRASTSTVLEELGLRASRYVLVPLHHENDEPPQLWDGKAAGRIVDCLLEGREPPKRNWSRPRLQRQVLVRQGGEGKIGPRA